VSGGNCPNLEVWVAYCEECEKFRTARRAPERDAEDGMEYFAFICSRCGSTLFSDLCPHQPLQSGRRITAAFGKSHLNLLCDALRK
jgi:hypothetical protein